MSCQKTIPPYKAIWKIPVELVSPRAKQTLPLRRKTMNAAKIQGLVMARLTSLTKRGAKAAKRAGLTDAIITTTAYSLHRSLRSTFGVGDNKGRVQYALNKLVAAGKVVVVGRSQPKKYALPTQ